ncbi:hypothetical protein FRB97_000723 [Tulasnella sp. 331]|nr:hypothetical protein FRB97_000723 [Tulasnella sp. 331]
MPALQDKIHAVWLCIQTPYAGGRLWEKGDVRPTPAEEIKRNLEYEAWRDDEAAGRVETAVKQTYEALCVALLKRLAPETTIPSASFSKHRRALGCSFAFSEKPKGGGDDGRMTIVSSGSYTKIISSGVNDGQSSTNLTRLTSQGRLVGRAIPVISRSKACVFMTSAQRIIGLIVEGRPDEVRLGFVGRDGPASGNDEA